jgi:hypothetical protein
MPRALSYTLAGIGLFWLTYSAILGIEALSHTKLQYGPLGIIIIGAALIACGLFWHISRLEAPHASAETSKAIIEPKFSWVWEPLTENEIEAIAAYLRNSSKATVTMTFNARASGQMAASFARVFERAGWGLQPMPQLHTIYGGLTGLSHSPNNDIGKSLKSAVEARTNLRVNFVALRHASASESSMFIIGAKPPPTPLPPDIKKDLNELGQKLKETGSAIVAFAMDRQREEALLPSRESYSPDTGGARKSWERSVAFSRETEALLAQRFQQSSFLLGQLEIIGVEMPFQVQTAQSRPARIGKWFNLVGSYLEQGQVEEARIKGSDNDFWFSQ